MKVCIVTLIKSNNCGSYWQALALGQAIRKLGHSVCYFDFDYTYSFRIKELKRIIGMFAFLGIKEACRYLKSNRSFSKLRKDLIITNAVQDVDVFVLGSDTIWNLESKNLHANFEVLWGELFKQKKIIAYAGSVANAREELFIDKKRLKEAVSLWSYISVRDEYTRHIISGFTNDTINLVCDPTLLLSKDDYCEFENNGNKSEYIYLYLFKDLSDKQNTELREFATANNLKIVQGVNGIRLKSADYSIENTPINFLNYMKSAKYIVTDTFHGTIFSINLNKQFVSINRGKNKVNEALCMYDFEDRLVSASQSLIDSLTSPIDYNTRMNKVDALRVSSWNYLKNALNH